MDKNVMMAQRIAGLVAEAGGRAFFVGGLVRDKILGRENKDVDIEIHGITPQKLAEILDSAGERTVMGSSFGVFGLRHYELDIAMPRCETANGRGHKDFDIYVDPFIGTEKAAGRRDFTMNALMQDVLTGEIIDHFDGIGDLERKTIRHVNDQTFAEDPLRVFRAAQFAARFDFSVADETHEISRGMDVSALAAERVVGETEKALTKSPRPSVFFEELRIMNQLPYWFPVLEELSRDLKAWQHSMTMLDAAARLQNKAGYPVGFLFASVCPDPERLLHRITNEIKLIRYAANMNRLLPELSKISLSGAGADDMAVLFDQSVSPNDLILLLMAERMADGKDSAQEEARLREMLSEYNRRMELPFVKGEDLVNLGFTPGIRFNEALKFAHQMRLHGTAKEEALAKTCELLRKAEAASEQDEDGNGKKAESSAVPNGP